MKETVDAMLSEFQEEAAITKRVLQRVPADKLTWRPHRNSMSLGELAFHIARIPGNLTRMVQQDGMDIAPANIQAPPPSTVEEIHSIFEESVQAAEKGLSELTEDAARGSWRLSVGGKEVFSKPRAKILRTMLLNHWVHHRGQMSVYLRLLEVPVPVIYGRSADENPFG